ncbi:oxygenase [Lithospermum erythrorhizon]|uniref:Flavin-containing monooxygenase n=1 Tax=Lithospermum erythrorhizon TaxID=34254 RepID=A0AAV3RJN6_LITER
MTLTIQHFPPPPPLMPPLSRNVAVIGAGSAGIVSARELHRKGHKVTVFEKRNQLGGTWVYTPEIEPDPIGINPGRKIIHSSLYSSLRTNLPREVMGFRDYPFVSTRKPGRDDRRFPGHVEVLEYLREFSCEFGVDGLVRFGTEVCHVGRDDDGKWLVKSRTRGDDDEEVFDAVVVCNGHYTEPRIADIPGIHSWPGKQIHSHNYRSPEAFQGQVVVLIGSANSADDISREISNVAKEVHIASRSVDNGFVQKISSHDNLWLRSMIKSVHDDGAVTFEDGGTIYADVILYCTGYKYHFPFLDTNEIVTVDDNRVGPLYKHVFPPMLAPWLSFVGLPWKVIPFPLCELQSKWIASVLSGQVSLPSADDMMADVEAFYSSMEASSVPKRYTHNMSDYQFDYDDWLAEQCGCSLTEEWRKEMYSLTSKRKRAQPETYRDKWDDEEWLSLAQQDFIKYLSNMSL